MSDPIRPPLAGTPEQVCRLIADALSDGDLDAALGYYEPDALICLPGAPAARGTEQITQALARAVTAKLAFDVHLHRVLAAGSIALLAGNWTARGTDDLPELDRAGPLRSITRRGPDGGWRVVVEDLESLAAEPADSAPRKRR